MASQRVTIECNKGDLVGSAEAAEILKKEVPQITRWRKAGKMPKPVEELKATFVWLRSDIERKAEEMGIPLEK